MKALIFSFLLALFITGPAQAIEKTDEKRLDEVEEREKHVMPFDLDKTLHIFTKTDQGGIQQVIAKNSADTEQIDLIRAHLRKISEEFSQGNFSNPEKIHGANMPGLAELKTAKPGEIKIEYSELPNGAQIIYSSEFPKFIEAIHQWFDAQLRDHARHAVSGENHHHMHHNK